MKKSALLGIIATALILAACGGNSDQIPNTIVLPGNAQTSMGSSTYVAGTEEYAAFIAINQFRASVGLGYWQENAFLDHAALNHIYYSESNTANVANPFQNDLEVQTYNGTRTANFSGTTPSARAIAAGYYYLSNTVSALNVPTASVGELYSTGSGANIVNAMVNTIYHRSGLMAQGTLQMGLARDTFGPITSANPTHWWLSHGNLTSGQSVASNFVALYPTDQQSNVPVSMDKETPSVYSNKPDTVFANISSPVSFTTSSLNILTTTSFTVEQVVGSTSTALPGDTWTFSNDPNMNTTNYSKATINLNAPPAPTPTISAFEAYWVGHAAFLPNTTYRATFVGSTYLTVYGITNQINQSWTFTTGNSN